VTHYLRQHLVGKKISKVVAPDDNIVFGKVGTSGPAFEKALTGNRVVSAGSQGKYFWLELEKPPHPVMHLGMVRILESFIFLINLSRKRESPN
jgi:formamidopyrimidine-DNA glycosylase